jgi:hypothetical protein
LCNNKSECFVPALAIASSLGGRSRFETLTKDEPEALTKEDQGTPRLSAASSELVERGDLDELTRHVNRLVAVADWDELAELRLRCQLALERGKQLWAVSSHIEYRLALEAPGRWGASMLEAGTGRFALGPLPEVAASTHSWAELSAHLHPTPQAAMAAHERVMRGEDLTDDPVAGSLPEVLDLPLVLQPWEPSYALADYHPDRLDAPSPALPPLARLARSTEGSRRRSTATRGEIDGTATSLVELVSTWTEESNGRAEAIGATGDVMAAIGALGAQATELVELAPGTALAMMAWAGGSGGAHGRRRGAAPGRFAAWLVLAALGDLSAKWPLDPDELGDVLQQSHWYAWGAGEPETGWVLRLAVERAGGPGEDRAWAVAATDLA